MNYNLVPSNKAEDPDLHYIYVLPTSFEGSSYSIAYPECKEEDILAGRLSIRQFDGCSIEAALEITTELKERLKKKQIKYSERINTLFTAGIGILVLGIVNWVIPDPLPFVDELVFTLVGGITAWKAWKDRKIKLPLLTEQTYRYGYDNFKPEVELDTILSTLFKSIRCKIDPKKAGDSTEEMDKIELESLWMTKYLSNQDLLISDNSDSSDLIRVLESILSLKKIIKLEKRKKRKRFRNRLKTLKQEIIDKTSINQDVLAVYIEFYRLYLIFQVES